MKARKSIFVAVLSAALLGACAGAGTRTGVAVDDSVITTKVKSALLAVIEPQMRLYPRDDRLHEMRARAYAALGKRLRQHQAQAEVYALRGSLPAAIEQLQLAQSAGDGNFYELSAVEARLKELRAEHVRELKESQQRRK